MKKYLLGGAALAATLAVLMSCQQPASNSSVVSQLAYSDSPTWAGSTWAGSGSDFSASAPYLVKVVTTVSGTATTATTTTATTTTIALQDCVYALKLNADGSFVLTETCSYDANWAQNYVPDEIYYSANSITYLPNSVAPAPGTEYMIFSGLGGGFQDAYALINGQSYSPNLIMTGSPFSAIAGLSGTTATIGAAADTTVYPGSTYYPVTFSPGLSTLSSVGSAEAGQTYEVATISGTYKTASATSNPVDSTTIPLFTSISGSFVKTSYSSVTGAVASTNNSSVTYTPATDPLASFAMSLGKATNSSGVVVNAITLTDTAATLAYNNSMAKFALKSKAKLVTASSGASRGLLDTAQNSNTTSVVLYQE